MTTIRIGSLLFILDDSCRLYALALWADDRIQGITDSDMRRIGGVK